MVNGAFGSDVPELMALILKELDIERKNRDVTPSEANRKYYELDEMTPAELLRHNELLRRQEECVRIENEAAKRRKDEYLMFVTDQIIESLGDLGVTVFMPHVASRELLKKLSEPADKCQLAAKEKKTIQIRADHLDALRLDCDDFWPEHVIDRIIDKDVFMVCWKVTDIEAESFESVARHLTAFVNSVWTNDCEAEPADSNSVLRSLSVETNVPSKVEREENAAEQCESSQVCVKIPPVWAPTNRRTNAMLIYLYFRSVNSQPLLTVIQNISCRTLSIYRSSPKHSFRPTPRPSLRTLQ